MSQKKKLLKAIKANPKDVRYSDALKAAEMIGFTKGGGKGSHAGYAREGEIVQLNFQEVSNGKAKPYQVRQLIEMINKYDPDGTNE